MADSSPAAAAGVSSIRANLAAAANGEPAELAEANDVSPKDVVAVDVPPSVAVAGVISKRAKVAATPDGELAELTEVNVSPEDVVVVDVSPSVAVAVVR